MFSESKYLRQEIHADEMSSYQVIFSKQVRSRNNSHRVDYSCPYKFNFSKNGDVGHHKITFVMLNKISNFSYPSSVNKSNDIPLAAWLKCS